MIVLLLRNNVIHSITLPLNVYGNYWLTEKDEHGNEKNLINIIEEDSKWKIKSNQEFKILDSESKIIGEVILREYSFYYIRIGKEDISILYCCPAYDKSFVQLEHRNINEILIGSNKDNQIIYNIPMISEKHAKLTFKDNKWQITDLDSQFGVYINNKKTNSTFLYNGDVVFIMGLKLILLDKYIFINNPFNSVTYDKNVFSVCDDIPEIFMDDSEDEEEKIELYEEDDYFFRSPRFKTMIEKEVMIIDSPPTKEKMEEIPLIYVIGPMLTMGMMSMMTVYSALDSYFSGERDFNSVIPSLLIGLAMLSSMILWPMLNKKFQKKQKIKYEKERQVKYGKYIDSKREMLDAIMKKQRQILIENYIPLNECEDIILNRSRQLWERKIDQPDFLSVRLGMGNTPLEIDIRYPEEHFSMDEDNLKVELNKLVNVSKDIADVPISFSFAEKYFSAVVGKREETNKIMMSIIFQLVTFHSYEDLKLIFLVDEDNKDYWEYVKVLPHVWSNDKQLRFYATDYEEMIEISSLLEKDLQDRLSSESINSRDYKSFSPYYIIITDNYKVSKNIRILIEVLKQKKNIGYSVIVIGDNLSSLPNECTSFISVSNIKGGLFESELISTKQKEFILDTYPLNNLSESFKKLSNIPIRLSNEIYALPRNYTFLEMYDVGKVEQLNSLYRWKTNNSILTLQVPIGIDSHGVLSRLDIHEKAHGPHGLIAGMTGSGKSELILTYILSLAVNYHPDDVSFVLIDYKGGFLAGALKNEEIGIKIPHLVGTITNLDTVELKRSLVSIQSELRRRQVVFNKTRELLNESTIDIYKYQKFYHEGLVDEPIPHLLIICDEFAELKVQQPDFMDQLISTARIGRSLGVHLILSTQKPSGIVNDQIWSNSRFKICLKVQEKSDSMDVIKLPDAANLKQVGRYYLQVGYNEYLSLGQTAWCGAPYIPADKIKKEIDKSLDFVDNIGSIYKEVEDKKKTIGLSKGEQISHVVRYLSDIAIKENIAVRQLWLDRIPDKIYNKDLIEKYTYTTELGVINPIIGEYDDPFNQRQNILTIPLSEEGNTIVYGAADSGIELLLNEIIYSTITSHTVKEVNFYILDFGTETLRVFTEAPHVGDILFLNDTDKINNLFKTLKKEMDRRKKLFSIYDGDYKSYIKDSGNIEPSIIVIINNYEAFQETYSDYDEIILQLTREGLKYGIIFIITTSSPSSIRYKLSKNFRQNISLQLNDIGDYSTIFGNVKGTYPSKNIGRGLIKLDNIYEFQTANVTDESNMNAYIKDVCLSLKKSSEITAKEIPILPEKITLDVVINSFKNINSVPIGMEKDSLETYTYNFKHNLSTIISAFDISSLSNFTSTLIKELSYFNGLSLVIIDTEDMLTKYENQSYEFYNSNFDKVFEEIYENVDKQYNLYKESNYNKDSLNELKYTIFVLVGIERFKNRISEDNKVLLDSVIDKARELEKYHFVLVDSVDKLKKLEYDSWYRNMTNGNQGIWIGNGITDQFSLKLTKVSRDLYDNIGNNFGYVIERGIPTLIKLIEEGDNNE